MTIENPFVQLETHMSQTEQKRMLAQALRQFELSKTMHADQYSDYHTEGGEVADHYRLIFNVMNAILNEQDPKARERLRPEVRKALETLDPSIKETIREFPAMMRYIVLTHDLAKKSENRTFNVKKFHMSEKPDELPEKALNAAKEFEGLLARANQEAAVAKEKLDKINKEIKPLEKKAKSDPESAQALAALQAEKKDLQVMQERLQQEQSDALREVYDQWRQAGLSGKDIHEHFGAGVGFVDHEAASAKMVEQMPIPDQVKAILKKLAEDHIIPLQRFSDPKMDAKNAATLFNRTYSDYARDEFRLSLAMAALDALGSIPKEGSPNMTPIENILKGKRELQIQERIKERLDAEVVRALAENPEYAELSGVDVRDPNTPKELKQKFSGMRKAVEEALRKKIEAELVKA